MKIAFINGICVRNDAISSSIRDEIHWLMQAGHDVRFFSYACDFEDINYIHVKNESQIILHPFFQEADYIVFHFGVYYGLFNCIMSCPKHSKKFVVFHNITPQEFLPSEVRPLIEKSFSQMANCSFADTIICVSEVNAQVLKNHGIVSKCITIPLSFDAPLPPSSKPSFTDDIIRLLFVGRFVQSKNPDDVLKCLHTLVKNNQDIKIDCTFIGNTSFSDENIIKYIDDNIKEINNSYPEKMTIRRIGNVSNKEKWKFYADSDIFILPSQHEGFCVPILEAFSQGCQVISYDNSNIPFISGGLATLVPTKNLELLQSSIFNAILTSKSQLWKEEEYKLFLSKCLAWTNNFSTDKIKKTFIKVFSSSINYI